MSLFYNVAHTVNIKTGIDGGGWAKGFEERREQKRLLGDGREGLSDAFKNRKKKGTRRGKGRFERRSGTS